MRKHVVAVCAGLEHSFSKPVQTAIALLPGLGVEGDAHAGGTVKHLSRVAKDPAQPNLRQVHMIHAELFDELATKGFSVGPGDVGDNITTRGVDLLGLPTGTLLRLGDTALVAITGLRNPCLQLNRFAPGLMEATLEKAPDGSLVRKCGVMGVVLQGGTVKAGDTIEIAFPPGKARPLGPV
jgi:MOSC domain-containing protein YiiM